MAALIKHVLSNSGENIYKFSFINCLNVSYINNYDSINIKIYFKY